MRGRVGRSSRQAYAYLLTPEPEALTADAAKRLDAIEAAGELGIGFTLATQDMEIRGAGQLLGEEQSGQMESIGFSLYMQMLNKAVEDINKGKIPDLDNPLNEVAKEHKKYRDSSGALRLNLPKTDIKIRDQRVMVFPQIESESREMVSEMMVLAGRVIAQYSIKNNISMPYLSQASGKFSDEIIENIHNLSLSKAFEAAKGFSRSKLSVKPSMHAGLGLELSLIHI